ncbi:DUF4825 domain-containing protein [Exiguobacterium sp. SL-10]|uniref:DUF4825 domain-containing protein n=1 Tax=unclassified Exiguobacterium TaxID=2644629 RepID=UPI00103E9B53|nr:MULTISPECIES: DUF4825 domain-containing protein [unclassified Exiguobacterium]TCI23496.1 DUF4825 domain-containing protein [Exiguobacterium sp. SL-9]TCI31558.1 DUF4825 domain-containing protein [Exiguobacterium sp. SL-10]
MKRLSLLIVMLIVLAGCGDTQQPRAFQYKGSYVGDNSAVAGIAQTLPMHDCYKSIELQTKKRPYGLTVRYDDPELERIEQERLAIRNAATYFTLVQNTEIVRFAFPNRTYSFSRPEMEAWLDIDFSTIKWEKDLNEHLDEKISNKEQTEAYFKRI